MKAKLLAGLLGRVLVALPIAGCFSSCELVREDLAECPSPVLELRFIYDYNMEYANAFHNQVDCLSAWIFDSDGRLVTIEKVTDPERLSDESFRLRPELPAGTYHVVAYGGMDCERSSFRSTNLSEGSLLTDLRVQLDPACLTDSDRHLLHNHYYGSADFTTDPEQDTYVTVAMMRNTNTVHVALQHLYGSPIDCNDFVFEITDDNNDFNHENNLLATGEIAYKPYNTDNRSTGSMGTADDGTGTRETHAALAQFTTSRLVARTAANGKETPTFLHVRRASDGNEVFRIPLINYMLLFKSDNTAAGLSRMSDQEYLDRENQWNFVFFLDERQGDLWVSTRIIINDWEVRLNNTDF